MIPYISNGPLIFWMYPVFGIRGASWFLGVSEWLFGTLILLGFWNKTLGILGAAGSCLSFIMTVTIIPFMPNGWAASAGGFPAMTGNVAFLNQFFSVLLMVSNVAPDGTPLVLRDVTGTIKLPTGLDRVPGASEHLVPAVRPGRIDGAP